MNHNVSVDDSSPDPHSGDRILYGLADQAELTGTGWTPSCLGCSAKPDPSQVFDETWHDASSPVGQGRIPIATFNFTGVAVYVMGIIVSSAPENLGDLKLSSMFFRIDNQEVGHYHNTATNGSDALYSYNVTLFSKTGLSNGPHSITVTCGDGTTDSLCLLDRFIYTIEGSASQTVSNSSGDLSSIRSEVASSTNSLAVPVSASSGKSGSLSSPVASNSIPMTVPEVKGHSGSTSSQIFSSSTQIAASASAQAHSGVSGHISTGLFIGIIVGLALALILLIVACFLRRRRQRRPIFVQHIQSNDDLVDSKYSNAFKSSRTSLSDFQPGVGTSRRASSPPRYLDAKPNDWT